MGIFTKTKTESIKWLAKAEEADYELAINDSEAALQLRMIGLGEDDLKLLSAFQPVVRENIISVVDNFYSTILTVPELRGIIEKYSTIEHIRATFSKHIIEMFNGTLNQEFLDIRHKVARVHINVGLKPKWYISAFQNMQNELRKIVFKNAAKTEDQQALIAAISKILSFEQQLVLESYECEMTKSREAAFRLIREEVKGQIILIASELAMHSNRTNEAMRMMATKLKSFIDLVNKTTKQSHHSRDLATEGQSRLKELTEKILTLSAHTNDVEQALNR